MAATSMTYPPDFANLARTGSRRAAGGHGTIGGRNDPERESKAVREASILIELCLQNEGMELSLRYIDLTVPFANPYLLQSHFDRHGHEFGATSEQEYEQMADAFMSQAPSPDLHDGVCVNPRGNGMHDRLRLLRGGMA
jgi:hypothetical protein